MNHTSKKFLSARVQRFFNIIKSKYPDDTLCWLECQNSGDGRRYQITIVAGDKQNHKELDSFPRNYHMRTREFAPYLDGLLDIVENDKLF